MGKETQNLVDLDYLAELSGGDPAYQSQVLGIFMESTRRGLANLDTQIRKEQNPEEIYRQAHTLKSGLGVIRIQGMLEDLQQVEAEAQQENDREVMIRLLDRLLDTFAKATPELERILDGYKAG